MSPYNGYVITNGAEVLAFHNQFVALSENERASATLLITQEVVHTVEIQGTLTGRRAELSGR